MALSVQALLMSVTFPLSELLTETPLLEIDNAAHVYRVAFAKNVAEDGMFSAYDPYFNAGTVAGSVANPAAKVPALVAILAGDRLTPVVAWKLFVFVSGLIAALCVPLAMTWLRMDTAAIVIGTVWALCLWWASLFRWYHNAGMVAFVLCMFLSLPYVALIETWLRGVAGWGVLLVLGLVGALGMLCHPLFGLPVALWTVVFLVLHINEQIWSRTLALLIVVPALSLAPNLFWLIESFVDDPLTLGRIVVPHQVHVGWDKLWQEAIGLWRGVAQGSKMYPLLLAGVVTAAFARRQMADPRLAVTFVLAGVGWVFYSNFAASVDLLALLTQPNRFAPVGYLFLVIPAAAGAVAAWDALRSPRSAALARAAALAAVLALGGLTAINVNEVRREVSFADIGHYGLIPPRVRGTGPKTEFLLDWLAQETTDSARVLFETARGRFYDNTQIASYLGYTSQREFIGGHYIDSYFADFADGEVFGRPIGEFTPPEFFAYLDLYNIGWIVAYTAESQQYLAGIDGIGESARFDGVITYRVYRAHNYFVRGNGTVASRSHNRVVLDQLSGSSVVVKYHYMRGLVGEPAVELQPVYLGDDPNPFIELVDPPESVVLSRRRD